MFGFKNFTGFTFIGKVGKVGAEFTWGIVEEITFNITSAGAANAAEIPENLNLNLPAKDKIIATATTAIVSKNVQDNLVGLIAGATPNLFM